MKFHLDTAYPVALDSPDHIQPRSTVRDNSINPNFNRRLLQLFPDDKKPSILDLGCAGGGMVKTLIDDGCIAVGLEGSDYNLLHQRAEWATIPDNLFTCDLGYPFILHTGNGKPYKFDVITAWEFMEHIPEERIDQLITNMRKHLKPGGLVIGSISDCDSIWEGIQHHLTRKPFWWWNEQFGKHEFERRTDHEMHFDNASAWVRKVRFNFVMQECDYGN